MGVWKDGRGEKIRPRTQTPKHGVEFSESGAMMMADTAENQHYVYIVECADGTYYTGYTTDVERRLDEHNAGTGAKYTRGRQPVTLVHSETYDSQSAAMRREYAIKQLRRPAKERLIRDDC
jgi:putative endonuclease